MRGLPNVDAWMARLMQRQSAKTVLEEKRKDLSKPLYDFISSFKAYVVWVAANDRVDQQEFLARSSRCVGLQGGGQGSREGTRSGKLLRRRRHRNLIFLIVD